MSSRGGKELRRKSTAATEASSQNSNVAESVMHLTTMSGDDGMAYPSPASDLYNTPDSDFTRSRGSSYAMLESNTPNECGQTCEDTKTQTRQQQPLPTPKFLQPPKRSNHPIMKPIGNSKNKHSSKTNDFASSSFGYQQRSSFMPSNSGWNPNVSMISRPSNMQPNKRLNKNELNELKDYLWQRGTNASGFDPGASVGPGSYNTGTSQGSVPVMGLGSSVGLNGSLGPGNSNSYSVSVVNQNTNDQAPFYTKNLESSFVNITRKKSDAVSNRVSRVYSGQYRSRASSATPFMAVPRESMALMVDAVKTSTMKDDEKCRYLFDLFDVDQKGMLSREGVRAFMEVTFTENNVVFLGQFDLDNVVEKVFAHGRDPDQMTYNDFCKIFGGFIIKDEADKIREEDEYASGRGGASAATTGSRAKKTPKKKTWWTRLKKNVRKYDSQIFWLSFYFALMIGVFIAKAVRFSYDPAVKYCPRVAKGFAQIIMVNTLFVLLPMCRNFVTTFRKLPVVVRNLPVDDHIEFHKICGVVMIIASLGHTIAWVMIVYYARTVSEDVWRKSRYYHLHFVRDENLFDFSLRLPMWTGVLMLVIAMIAVPFTHPKLRRGNFNAFWLTHLLFLPFIILIAVHGLAQWVAAPEAYGWIIPPILIYFIEKRHRVATVFGGKSTITRVQHSKEAVAIYMKKPRSFGKNHRFQPGMYMFINVPVISQFEWHPFTISSAPEDDFLSLHIRKAGDWTGALYVLLQKINESNPQLMLEANGSTQYSSYPTVYIDGPIGAPAQDYGRYREVVFVGAGIGVTPFASILRSIVYQWESYRCPSCRHVRFPPSFQLRKIYFYWVTREQEALTWFTNTMNQLSELDTENRLEIHNYFSSVKSESIIAPLQALQKFIHNTEGQDIVSGLNTKQMTHFGRPDWHEELHRIAENHKRLERIEPDGEKEEIGVFFCGPKPLGYTIHEECTAFNQDRNRSVPDVEFDFHSENF